MNIRAFQPDDEHAVATQWQGCGLTRPRNNPHTDIARKPGYVEDDLASLGMRPIHDHTPVHSKEG